LSRSRTAQENSASCDSSATSNDSYKWNLEDAG
jgi:hypothetical protein